MLYLIEYNDLSWRTSFIWSKVVCSWRFYFWKLVRMYETMMRCVRARKCEYRSTHDQTHIYPTSLNLLSVTNFFTASRLEISNGSYMKYLSLLIYTNIWEKDKCDLTLMTLFCWKHKNCDENKFQVFKRIQTQTPHLTHRGKPEVYHELLRAKHQLVDELISHP